MNFVAKKTSASRLKPLVVAWGETSRTPRAQDVLHNQYGDCQKDYSTLCWSRCWRLRVCTLRR